MAKAIYAGSFDPITRGHVDVIARASRLFDLTIGVAHNPQKKHLFELGKRIELIITSLDEVGITNINVCKVDGLLAGLCKDHGITAIVRGLRNTIDFESEFGMAQINADLGNLETVFLKAQGTHIHISSSMVKQIATLGGDFTPYVTETVKEALNALSSPCNRR